MAIMIPNEPPIPGKDGKTAERELYLALLDQLDDDFFVFYSLRYVEPKRAREGEVDFLVLHRKLGMLVVECKGGGVKRDGRGHWTRNNERADDPFAQAQGQIKALEKQLTPRTLKAFPRLRHKRLPFVHGHAVAFPMALSAEVNMPLDVPKEIIYDASDLDRIGERIKESFAFWKKAAVYKPDTLDKVEFRKFRRKLLFPNLNVVECIGAEIFSNRRVMVRLSNEQVAAVERWMDNPRIRVQGGAGTGKTVIAMEAARRLAEEGAKVLLLCFNKRLGQYLKRSAAELEPEKGRVEATWFHRLCNDACEANTGKTLAIPKNPKDQRRFWEEEAPYSILRALENGNIKKWDAVVIDEGQDFAALWWEVIEMLPADKDESRIMAFYDPSQNIFGRGDNVPKYPLIKLKRNFRNTQKIAEVVARLGNVEMTSYDRCPEGVSPEVRKLESPNKMRTILSNLAKQLVKTERLLPDQITILTPHSRKNSSLADMTELAGIPLADNPSKRTDAILHTTISAFKGLESDVIILSDIDPKDPLCSRNARYVAASRARHRLFVYTKGDWLK